MLTSESLPVLRKGLVSCFPVSKPAERLALPAGVSRQARSGGTGQRHFDGTNFKPRNLPACTLPHIVPTPHDLLSKSRWVQVCSSGGTGENAHAKRPIIMTPMLVGGRVTAVLGRCSVLGCPRSAIEYEPADFVSQPLIVQNKIANHIRQLLTLPLTLQATCLVLFTLNDGCSCSLYCIGGCA